MDKYKFQWNKTNECLFEPKKYNEKDDLLP